MKAKSLSEYLEQRQAAEESMKRLAPLRKKVAEHIESQFELQCAHLPVEAYGSGFCLHTERFELHANNLFPAGITLFENRSNLEWGTATQRYLVFYWDLFGNDVKVVSNR